MAKISKRDLQETSYEQLRKQGLNAAARVDRCECKGHGCGICNNLGYILNPETISELARTAISAKLNQKIKDFIPCPFCLGEKKASALAILPYTLLIEKFPNLKDKNLDSEHTYNRNYNEYKIPCIKCNATGEIRKEHLSPDEVKMYDKFLDSLQNKFREEEPELP